MSALDLGKQAELLILLDRLKEEGKTIILTSHNPNHALALSEEASVCLLDGGHILGIGTAKEVLCEENIHKIFGDKVTTDTQNSCIFFKLK